MTYKEGKTKVLSLELICKVIDEVSSLDLDEVAKEVKNNNATNSGNTSLIDTYVKSHSQK